MSEFPAYELLGTRVHALTIDDWVGLVERSVSCGERCIMVGQNLHSVYIYHRNHELRALQALANYVRIDGLPLVVFGRLLGYPLTGKHRSGFMDLLEPLMSLASNRGWRLFYLGSSPDVSERATGLLSRTYPGAKIDFEHGYFDIDDEQIRLALARRINEYRPDLLIVGMGMPRQERWILENQGELNVPAIVACGAAMDYVAGEAPMSPRWLSALGLEWLFRLISEPRRLWRRYLIEPWYAVGLFLADLTARYGGRR